MKTTKEQAVLVMVILCLTVGDSTAQSPYQLDWKKEAVFYGLGLGTFAWGAHLNNRTELLTPTQLETYDPLSINGFDRKATEHYSQKAHDASDVFWHGSFATPLLLLAKKESRSNLLPIAVLWGEVFTINSGLTVLTKYSVRRSRPYAYKPEVPLETKQRRTARGSFFSGHTSMTVVNTFFAAKVFSDYHPNSKWKPVVWGAAAVIPAVTGYLRVAAGKHYPIDAMVGYAVDALAGWGVPALHRVGFLTKKTCRDQWRDDGVGDAVAVLIENSR